ncbi:MAG TPA: hypothetical protein PL041_04440 [Melioribacteraceae bacterium]|nr:hypothetical protein [Melioribacteraceae bacterium]
MKKLSVIIAVLFFVGSNFVIAQNSKSLFELKNNINITEINNSVTPQQLNESTGKKSTALAILYSLVLPGMGELYAGDYSLGKYLTAADVVFWGATIGFNTYGKWQEDNYKSFAKSKGGVTYTGDDEDFFGRVGSYMSVNSYNREQELNRNFGKVYNPDTYYWNWNTNELRKEYRNMWTSSEQAYNNVRFAVGALILNRIVSVINAVRLVNKHNKNLNTEQTWNVNFGIDNSFTNNNGIKVNFVKALSF